MAMRLLTGCAAALLWAAVGAAASGATQPGGADPAPATAASYLARNLQTMVL
jgi:hypothetical protein